MTELDCTECDCKPDLAAKTFFCTRHQCRKTPHLHRLCRTHPGYFRLWEDGRGPGQPRKDPALTESATAPKRCPDGVGTELALLLRRCGINARPRECSCQDLAAQMDRNSPDWCQTNLETIVGWLEAEAHRRGLPFVRIVGRLLVGRAIRSARKNIRRAMVARWILHNRSQPNARLRVGFLTPTLLFGGAERWVAALAVGLDPAKIDVVGVAVRDTRRIFPAIGDTIRAGRPGCKITEGRPAQSFLRLAEQCEVLIAWGLPDLSMLRGYPGRVVLVSHGHCDWTVNAIRGCMPYVTDCASVSRHAVISFQAAGVRTVRVAVIHNGIDVDRCTPAAKTRDQTRAEWCLQPGEIAVGHVGRIADGQKNIRGVVEAVRLLGPGYRMVIVGDGPGAKQQIARWREVLPNLVARPAVNQVGDVYRALDCFVLPSAFEGFSLALAEAWYCGCPTVATPVGATELSELHGDLYVPVPAACTPDDIASAVRLAIAPENLPLVCRASRVVAEHYTAAAMCRRWEAYLERIVAHE